MSFRTGFLALGGLPCGALSVSFGLGPESYTPITPPVPAQVVTTQAVPPPRISLAPVARAARGKVILAAHVRKRG